MSEHNARVRPGERTYEVVKAELAEAEANLKQARELIEFYQRKAEYAEQRVEKLRQEAIPLLHAELEALGERQSDFGGPRP